MVKILAVLRNPGLVFLASGLFFGCSTAPPAVPAAVVERAEQDFEQILRFRNGGESNALQDSWLPTNPIGTGAQLVFHFPISYVISGVVNGPLVILGEGVECLILPIMGSSIQDQIDESIYQMYVRGASVPHLWDLMPRVGGDDEAWFGTDRLPAALPILKLVTSQKETVGQKVSDRPVDPETPSSDSSSHSSEDR
ncbi:MAG: hypothetical protein QF752_10540 [Planctomycetota bacterium]|nr:hypothetical protein [Planctomycetota bacterium]